MADAEWERVLGVAGGRTTSWRRPMPGMDTSMTTATLLLACTHGIDRTVRLDDDPLHGSHMGLTRGPRRG